MWIHIYWLLRFDDMDYDAVISSAETTIGLVEAIRKSMAEQAGSLFKEHIQVFTCHHDIRPSLHILSSKYFGCLGIYAKS